MRALLALACACLVLLPVSARQTVLFEMNMAASAAPSHGWRGANPFDGQSNQSRNRGVYYNLNDLPGEVRFSMIPVSSGITEGYFGYGAPAPSFAAIPQGSSVFVQFAMWARAVNPVRLQGGSWGGKQIILGDGCVPDSARFFGNLQFRSGFVEWLLDQNINNRGVRYQIQNPNLNYYQVEIRTSTTTTSLDAAIRLWVNNNNRLTPTLASTAQYAWVSSCLNAASRLGGYNNTMGSGVMEWGYTRFRISNTFDPTWYPGGTPPPVFTTPEGLRLTRGAN